jgi:N-acetyl-anhydromuramyl-L-alanine amidase AmpD
MLWLIVLLSLIEELAALDKVISDPLNNALCTKLRSDQTTECVFRSREINERPLGIMLHYTVCQSMELTKQTFYAAGVSSHYTIDNIGVAYCHVDPENIAFHAGKTFFRGMESLNKYFIGIEHINPGFVEPGEIYDPAWGQPKRIADDSRQWFSFQEQQFITSACLTADLQRAYKIRGSLVITHADAAVGQKFDIGPMYDYRRAFVEYNSGYYPESRQINLAAFETLSNDDYIQLLHGSRLASSYFYQPT